LTKANWGADLNAIAVIFAVLLSALWTAVLACATLAGFLVSDALGHRFHRLWAQGMLLLYGIRVRVFFVHPLPSRPAILAPNHASAFDIPIVASLPVDFKWVSKEEVRRIPLMGWAMVKMGCFFVSRRNSSGDVNVLKNVEEGLRRGKSVVIFPEGTRSHNGELLPLKKGTFRLAQNTGVPLCPIAISGSFAIAPRGGLPKRWGHKVTVRIGPAMVAAPGEDLALFADKYLKELVRLLDEGDAS
jgi:1-acyl-sn-glycerol-3-phosphate acyltransferase